MAPDVIHRCVTIGQSTKNLERGYSMSSDKIKMLALSAIVNVIVSAGTVYLYDVYYAQKVVVFDLSSYLDKQKTEFLAGRTDEEKLRKEFVLIRERIDALGEKRIVLSKDVVLSGGRDISDEISRYSEK